MKNRSHYFLYRIQQKFKTAVLQYLSRIFSAANSHQGSFLKNIGYDIASRLEIIRQSYTDEETRTITSPFLISVTLEVEIEETLQNKDQ
jgi:hypothetical protein